MDKNLEKVRVRRARRSQRIRNSVRGTKACPRMCVVKTNKHVEVQLIDDETGITLAHEGTQTKELRKTEFNKKNKKSAKALGEKIAAKAKAMGVERIVFDRGAFTYHGILAELADSARASGLQF